MRSNSLLAVAATTVTGVAAAIVDVHVGVGGALSYSPNSFTANMGDMVQFHFYSFHSVTESEFSTPCAPKSGGFYSGSVNGDSSGDKTFMIEVTSTDPIWFYCAVADHCNEGMVGVINPPSGMTESQYASAAMSAMIVVPSAVSGGTLTTVAAGGMATSMMSSSMPMSSMMSSSMMSSAMMSSSMMSSSMMSSSMMSSAMMSSSMMSSPMMSSAMPSSSPAMTMSMSQGMTMTSPAMTSPTGSSGTSGAGSTTHVRDGTVVMGLAVFAGALVALMA